MKKLPVDIQTFETMREDGYLYVDKTRFIHRMVDTGRFFFLSRPRRFGKSLTVSTLNCLFRGMKELFQGLWIVEHGNWEWGEYPVISIDFNGLSCDTPENLALSLEESLLNTAKDHGVSLDSKLLKGKFKELILSLHKITGMPVIVLVDEYDKPLIDHLGKGDESLDKGLKNRDILKSFLGVLKDGQVSGKLRFVFITGVSKFSRVSIFSELN
ncbi:MAG: AAA family ATPase, partial [Deltaproteobacteria bacterium]|nr:AAA family ATPase [Deltaproteobacteria bacterium]